MPLRCSPVTPAALRARRLNSLKSTGPRTARGKAWSCLNALRHGYRCNQARLRDKIARTGDGEALYLYDFIFEEIMKTSVCPNNWYWCRLRGLAVRAWCIESGRRGRKLAKTCLRTKLESGVRIFRYTEKYIVPRRLRIGDKAGSGFMLINPVPSRRRRVARGWIPEVEYTEGKLPKARRVREKCEPGTQIVLSRGERASGDEPEPGNEPESRGSRWSAISKAVRRVGIRIQEGQMKSDIIESAMHPEPQRIEQSILLIRRQKVMLDTDLAELYGASTKAFNQAIKRNGDRFPPDFMFRLTDEEKREVVTNCDHLRKLKFSNVLPAAFTEHGAIMAATVLNTPRAITVSVYVVRAFVKLRDLVNTQKQFARKLEDLERKLVEHDENFSVVFAAIRELMEPTAVPPKRRIGFSTSEESSS